MTPEQQNEFYKWWDTECLNYNIDERQKLKLVARRAWEAGVLHMGTFAMEAFKKSLLGGSDDY